jgi:hypothetical protein
MRMQQFHPAHAFSQTLHIGGKEALLFQRPQ